jgi:hypothetical protein
MTSFQPETEASNASPRAPTVMMLPEWEFGYESPLEVTHE